MPPMPRNVAAADPPKIDASRISPTMRNSAAPPMISVSGPDMPPMAAAALASTAAISCSMLAMALACGAAGGIAAGAGFMTGGVDGGGAAGGMGGTEGPVIS